MLKFKVIEKGKQTKLLNINYRREDDFWCGYKALDNNFNEIIDCRFYCTKGGTVTCCIWVYGNEHFSASGRAAGYGYEKKSAALQEALTNAGIVLNEYIDGSGYIKEPLEAVAKWATRKRNIHIVEMYG